MADQNDNEDTSVTRILSDTGKSLLDDAKTSIKVALVGAVGGSVSLGGAGFYYFGWYGLLIGSGVGAIIGGLGLWWMYMSA